MTASQIRYILIALLTSVIVMACRGVDQNEGAGGTGDLTIAITDGPADNIEKLNLYITGIELTPTGGGTPILIEDIEEEFFDLAKLQGGLREEIISKFDLADGTYNSIRLIIDEASSIVKLENDDNEYSIVIPNAELINLQLDVNILLDENNDKKDFTIDLDLRKSLRDDTDQNPPVYTLYPRLRIVETSRTETLTGTVDQALITDSRCSSRNSKKDGNAVYLFLNNSAAIQDLRNDNNDPYATTAVDVMSDNSGVFSFGYLPIQSYRAVFTCYAFDDNPGINDVGVELGQLINVDIEQGSGARINFDQPTP